MSEFAFLEHEILIQEEAGVLKFLSVNIDTVSRAITFHCLRQTY